MAKMRGAWYKPQKGDWFGHLISGYTRLFNWGSPEYCHVEVGIEKDGKWLWYSSASKNSNGTTGTRFLEEPVLFQHPERWDVYEFEALRSADDMLKTCYNELGKPYDWAGIFGFATIFGQLNAKGKWYCSEICQYVFTGEWVKRISPERFFALVKAKCPGMVKIPTPGAVVQSSSLQSV